jgi:hypothetical protein
MGLRCLATKALVLRQEVKNFSVLAMTACRKSGIITVLIYYLNIKWK